jgi:holo-[acyl-carrier protein] synthase
MIKGIGTDIVEIQRIKKLVEKYGDQFLNKVFTEAEIVFCKAKANPSIHFAGRWAAKEAFYKALPLTCQPLSSWKSVQVISSGISGMPLIEICSSMLQHQIAKESVSHFHISISHEQAYCIAFALLE